MKACAMATNLGFPYMGRNRELKSIVEAFWAGKATAADLETTSAKIRRDHWKVQSDAGIQQVPVGDFSLYDRVLDAAVMVGAIPKRYQSLQPGFEQYFAMARGLQRPAAGCAAMVDVPAMEMKKWLDTNYHYIVPEFTAGQSFRLVEAPDVITHIREAKAAGLACPRPVLVGPVSLLYMGKRSKSEDASFEPLTLLEDLLPAYCDLLRRIAGEGVEWVQIDEPILVLDLPAERKCEAAFQMAYKMLAAAALSLKIIVATYFERIGDNMKMLKDTKIAGIHIDAVRAPQQVDDVVEALTKEQVISLGVVDGRNIWVNDLKKSVDLVRKVAGKLGNERVFVAPSCSLLHSPFTTVDEKNILKNNPDLHSWLSFSAEKLREIVTIAKGVNEGEDAISDAIRRNQEILTNRRTSHFTTKQVVHDRVRAVKPTCMTRPAAYPERQKARAARFELPMLPTTTIGSFPQTKEIRQNRAKFTKGEITEAEYEIFLKAEIKRVVEFQEKVGLDVFVHGECERDDMVAHFGKLLDGYAFTENGWVVSYGSRCVKPPVIFGDVSRPTPMTVKWSTYAQSLTPRPMKGMLTGPVTMLKWAFPRDDVPLGFICKQIALAIRDEVEDLDKAGIPCIQVDEPAIREGVPLRRADWDAYLQWAVDSFKLATGVARKETQIHTHMCYSDFNDIFGAIKRMDADVITIENSRSDCKLLKVFETQNYTNEIGPGIYDIHSPRVPSVEEMATKLVDYLQYLPQRLVWVNPDCGLKSRGWAEVEAALTNMVSVAKAARAKQN